MKINQKIIIGFLVVALLILAGSYIGMTTQEKLVKNFQEVAGELFPGTIIELKMHAELHHVARLMERYGSSGTLSDRKKTAEALSVLAEYTAEHRIYHSGHHSPAYIDRIDEIIESFTSFTMEYLLARANGASEEELDIVRAKIDLAVNVFISQIEPTLKEHIKTAREAVKETKQSVTRAKKFILGSSAVIFSLALVWGFFIARFISKPIRKLSEATDQISKGQLDVQIEVTSKDEIGQSAICFNKIIKELKTTTVSRDAFASEGVEREKVVEALRKSEEKLTGIVDSVTDAMIMVDDQYNVVWNNDIATEVFGPDLVGKKCHRALHGRDELCKQCIVKACFNDGKVHEFETEIIGTDGKQRSFRGKSSVAERDKDGRPKMVVEFLRDITERK